MQIKEKPKKRLLTADDIITKGNLYPRNTCSWQITYSYSQSMKAGAKFPLIEVAKIKNKYYLIDGKHRLEAIKRLNREGTKGIKKSKRVQNKDIHVQCLVYSTLSLHDVYILSVERNIVHGLPFTSFDKMNIVKKLEGMKLSAKRISELVRMPVENIQRLKITKMTHTISGKPVVLKSSLVSLAGVPVPDNFEEYQNDMDGGKLQTRLLDDIIILLEKEVLDFTNNMVLEKFNHLKRLIMKIN